MPPIEAFPTPSLNKKTITHNYPQWYESTDKPLLTKTIINKLTIKEQNNQINFNLNKDIKDETTTQNLLNFTHKKIIPHYLSTFEGEFVTQLPIKNNKKSLKQLSTNKKTKINKKNVPYVDEETLYSPFDLDYQSETILNQKNNKNKLIYYNELQQYDQNKLVIFFYL